jgi:hypothetical protein
VRTIAALLKMADALAWLTGYADIKDAFDDMIVEAEEIEQEEGEEKAYPVVPGSHYM